MSARPSSARSSGIRAARPWARWSIFSPRWSAIGVDNAVIEIDGPEVPIMDGSARAFVDAIEQAASSAQGARTRFIKRRKPVRVELGTSFAEFRPI